MDDKFAQLKKTEQDDNNRKIEDEIERISEDPKMCPFASTIVKNLSLHRNTVKGSRTWYLTRPLRLGDEFIPAGQHVALKDLLDIIKECRLNKKRRRTKKQIRKAEDLTEELDGVEEILGNMKDQNADLKHEIDDLKEQYYEMNRMHKYTIGTLNNELKLESERSLNFLQRIGKLETYTEDLEAELKVYRSKTGKKGTLSILKSQTGKQ